MIEHCYWEAGRKTGMVAPHQHHWHGWRGLVQLGASPELENRVYARVHLS